MYRIKIFLERGREKNCYGFLENGGTPPKFSRPIRMQGFDQMLSKSDQMQPFFTEKYATTSSLSGIFLGPKKDLIATLWVIFPRLGSKNLIWGIVGGNCKKKNKTGL